MIMVMYVVSELYGSAQVCPRSNLCCILKIGWMEIGYLKMGFTWNLVRQRMQYLYVFLV